MLASTYRLDRRAAIAGRQGGFFSGFRASGAALSEAVLALAIGSFEDDCERDHASISPTAESNQDIAERPETPAMELFCAVGTNPLWEKKEPATVRPRALREALLLKLLTEPERPT